MKRRVLIILLAVVFCLSLVMVVACDQAHTCESKCSDCGLCTNKDCKEDACKDKCQGHVAPPTHTCGHVCPTCNKCTDLTCTNSVCADKCPSHGTETVKVTKINITGMDEEGNDDTDGTLAAPFVVSVAQGHDVELGANVQPSNATDKTFNVTVGKIENNAFVATPDVTGLTATINTKITLAAAADLAVGGGIVVEVKAKDGSNVATYLNIVVKEYVSVTQITSSALKASEEEGIDYELQTAVGTNWNMSKGMTSRGQAILAGEIDGKSNLQVPTSLLYFPNINNLGLTVLPNNASEKDYTITYSVNDIVEVASDGALTVKKAGETVITITSDSNSEVVTKIKVTVVDVIYRGLLKSEYAAAEDAANVNGGWDFDTQHATPTQKSRFEDWHMVLVHSNLTDSDIANPGSPTSTGWDNGQKIFYDGDPNRPYGIAIENHVRASSGASLLESTGMMWAKLTIPESAITFNIKMQATGSGKDYSEYRVVFVNEEGVATVMTDGWVKTPVNEATVKVTVPAAIKGQKGALIVEARVTKANESVEFHAKVMKFEGQVDVTSVVYSKETAEYKVGERVIDNITASVRPDNATNDKVTYAMHDDDKDKGVTVDANTGVITIAANAAAGTYRVVATSVADNTKKATLTITLTNDEIEVNEWTNKNDIINGVADVKWNVIGNIDMGVGEGADINCNGGRDWSAISLSNRAIKDSSFILTFGARVFHRDGETYPHFIVKVIEDGEEAVVIRGIGQENDYFYVDTDATQYCSYDLSAYIGKTVEIQIGIDRGTHAVIQSVKFTGSETKITSWANKTELLDKDGDPWTIVGDQDSGVGEGADIMHTNSYLCNEFMIGAYNAKFTFGARVFHRDGETYPDIKVIVKVGETETLVRAIGVNSDIVHVDTDAVQSFSYDLSAFIGKKVEIRIQLANNATHCVIANAKLEQQEIVKVDPEAKIGDTEYETLAAAIEAAKANDTIVLQKDVKIETTLVITKKITLDLNGKTISSDNKIWGTAQAGTEQNNWSMISVQAGGDLTITGNGKVIAKEGDLTNENASCYAVDVRAADAKLTIENGEFVGNRTCIYVRLGSAEIKGGKYSIYAGSTNEANGHKFVLNLKDNVAEATLKVTGGQFVNYDPSNAASEAPAGHFVPETGYTVTSAADGDNTIYTVAAAE